MNAESAPAHAAWRPRLRRLTVQVLLAAFIGLIILQFIAGRFLYANGFEEAERRDLLARTRHAQAVLQQGFSTLEPAAKDYAEWIATLEFVAGNRAEYPLYNWQAWTFKRFEADLVAIVDLHGRSLLSRALDSSREGTQALTRLEAAALDPDGPLLATLRGPISQKGYLMIGNVPYMWAAASVRDEAVPPIGWLLLLRRLDARVVGRLEKTLDSRVRFGVDPGRVLSGGLPAIPLRPAELLTHASTDTAISATFVAGVLPGWHALNLTLTTDRPLMATMARVTRYFLLACLAAGAIVALLTVSWLQRRLLGPLHQVGQHLRDIGSSNNLSVRLPPVGRSDEITGVAIAANQMLDQIVSMRSAELARDAAIEATKAKSAFLARMTHELRTPMNGVLGMTDLLTRTPLNSQQRRYAETIRHSADSLLGIINDTLDFSKIEAGKLVLEDRPFDLEEVVETAAEMLAEPAQGKNLELITRILPGVHPRYRGDALRLRQVLVNLLSNAVKFTDYGHLSVVVRASAASATVHEVTIEVADTGVGVEESDQAMIFDSFAQADTSGKRKYGGTGLGLAICRQLVGLMGGQIGVRSVRGKGSTFWLKIPLQLDGAVSPPADCGWLHDRRLLIVMKSLLSRAVLVEYVNGWGASADESGSVADALQRLRAAARRNETYHAVVIESALFREGRNELMAAAAATTAGSSTQWVRIDPISEAANTSERTDATIRASVSSPVGRAKLRATLQDLMTRNAAGGAIAESPATAPTRKEGWGLRMLLVEDNPVNQEVAVAMLASLGCSVVVTHDGRQGFERFQQSRFDVVLMDCEMPEFDGYEATKAIRGWERRHAMSRTPIIALTANVGADACEKCMAAGMDRFLPKPFLLNDLRLMLEEYRAVGKAVPG